jgi:type II secretory pathway component GspD/PulD (secretin)
MANDGTDRVNQVFKLRYAPASDVAERVQTLLTSREQNLALDPAALAKRTAVVVAEPVSNSVLVSADADTLKAIEKLIDLIDAKPAVEEPKPAPTPAGGPRPGGMGPPPMGGSPLGEKGALNVFTLKKATAEEMVGVLRKLFPNADIVADPRTNTVIARTDEKTLTDIRALIVRLEAIEPAK